MAISVANVTTTISSVYTSAGNSAITFASLCNYSAGNVTVDVHIVPAGGTAGNSNIILSSLELTAEDTYQLYQGGEKLLLDDSDSIQVEASDNDAVTVVISHTAI